MDLKVGSPSGSAGCPRLSPVSLHVRILTRNVQTANTSQEEGKVPRAALGACRAALGAGGQSREFPSLSSTGREEQLGFPGINQSKDSSKPVPTFQSRTCPGSSSLPPFLQTLQVSQGAAVSWGGKIPQICSQNPQETLPGPALGLGQTPQGHQPPAGAVPEGMEPQESHRRPHKTLPVFQFQAQDPSWDPAVAALPRPHSPRDASMEPGMNLG